MFDQQSSPAPADVPTPGAGSLATWLAERAQAGRRLPAGPDLAAHLMEVLADPDVVEELDPAQLVDAAAGAHRLAAWAHAQQLSALAALDARLGEERAAADTEDLSPAAAALERLQVADAGDEFAVAAAVSAGTADRLVRTARTLADRAPGVLEALGEGRLDAVKAAAVAAVIAPPGAEPLSDEAAAAVEQQAVTAGVSRTRAQLLPLLHKAALEVDPDAAQNRRKAAAERRDVRTYPDPDGMATLSAHGTAEQITSIDAVLQAYADGPRTADDTRSIGARRMDALHALVTGALTPEGLVPQPAQAIKAMSRPGAELQIVISAESLTGAQDTPAFLTGYGALPAGAARDLAADARWRRILTDKARTQLLEVAGRTYAPSKRLARYIRHRDARCCHPRCNRPAVRCDLDHTINWPGGPTCPCNLTPLCRRHHNAKTAGRWRLTQPLPGLFEWTSERTGQTITVRPDPPWRLTGAHTPPDPLPTDDTPPAAKPRCGHTPPTGPPPF
jgi:hypothetical protein